MDRQLAHPVRANRLLHRLAIEEACDAGCRSYHMGHSRPGSSLAEFKQSFGADKSQLHPDHAAYGRTTSAKTTSNSSTLRTARCALAVASSRTAAWAPREPVSAARSR